MVFLIVVYISVFMLVLMPTELYCF